MEVIIGILFISGAVCFGIYIYRVKGAKVFEMRYMQASTIKDVEEIAKSMSELDPSYRHYVELKGVVESTEPVTAPFSNRNVVYYENHCYTVRQETHTARDRDGNVHTYTTKVENEISHEKSSTQVYITDKSCDTKVFVDVNSFGKDAELMPACNRFEQKGSEWLRSNMGRFSFFPSNFGSHFLGYRFEEKILLPRQPLYILGELYCLGDVIYIGRATLAKKKPSMLSYKSEDEIISDTKRQRTLYLALCLGAVLVGAIFIFVGLNP